ncbi:MAG: hypothetical protein ABL989_09565 [Gammaproteobacteria bacterium]
MARFAAIIWPSVTAVALAACAPGADAIYTLYRSSPTTGGAEMRIHVATFDANESPAYNRDNCEITKGLFQDQPGIVVTYWCERERFQAK